jgi:hypothetical protein
MKKYTALLISALLAGIVVQWYTISRLRSENQLLRDARDRFSCASPHPKAAWRFASRRSPKNALVAAVEALKFECRYSLSLAEL